MYGSVEEIINKIVESTDMPKEKVEGLVKEKEMEFSGLISPEGAAHIVAKELGLNLLESISKELKIGNVPSGMKSVNVVGKVMRIFEPKEFTRNGEKGKVVSIILADETGQIRLSLWNEQVKSVESGEIHEGDVIEIINGYTKGDNFGGVEIRIGKSGKIKKSDKKIDAVETGKIKRTKINKLSPGKFGEIRGAIVQFFETNPFFYVCPQCGARLVDNKCEEHGEVEPKPVLILSGVIDDGYGNIRIVFFREQAEKVLGMSSEEAYELTENGKNTKKLFDKLDEILGKEFIVRGRTKINKFFERLEFIASEVEEVDPEKEAKGILNILEKKS
ncbi:MAG: DUF2240 family protein [Candidatus Aenigmarchaeota archaeon]|nr:DUF2240 family protein [Candidatus Aenigmarchaeota archaeon]